MSRKIFIDCGFYVGKALEYYEMFLDDTWEVYAFEPHPIPGIQDYLNKFPFKIRFFQRAVWTHDGTTELAVGGREDASHLKELKETQDPVKSVRCIDFSRFVDELDGTIVVSMDIEGAEFPVLEKMLTDGTSSKIWLLDIEFHHRLLDGKDEGDVNRLRRALEGEGTLVKLKVGI